MIGKVLFKLAKKPLMGGLIGNAFRWFAWAVPVKKVYEGKEAIAFFHPKPSYKSHIVIVPKRAIANLQMMSGGGLCGYFEKIWEAAAQICAEREEFAGGAILMANGGKRQEVGQVHFHLFTGSEVVNGSNAREQGERIAHTGGAVIASELAKPGWEKHYVLQPASGADRSGYFRDVLRCIDVLDAKEGIVRDGYALVYQGARPDAQSLPGFHIISGKRLEQKAAFR